VYSRTPPTTAPRRFEANAMSACEDGEPVAQRRQVEQQLIGRQQVREEKRPEEQGVEERARYRAPRVHGDRGEHADEDADDGEHVHEPGRPEEQRERREALRLEQQESDAEDEEVRAEPAR